MSSQQVLNRQESSLNQQHLFGIGFYNGYVWTAAKEILNWATQGDHLRVVTTPNVDHIINLSQKSPEFNRQYCGAYWHFPDGMPIVWASRLLGRSLQSRIPGSDLFPLLLSGASKRGLKIAVIGANPELLERFRVYCRIHYPGLTLASLWSAPSNFDVNGQQAADHAEALRHLSIDILFVGIGFSKQESWIFNYGHQTSAKVAVGIGASIEFLVGVKARAPKWMRGAGLEWVHRLASEPKRLTFRYLRDFSFFRLLLDEWRNSSESALETP